MHNLLGYFIIAIIAGPCAGFLDSLFEQLDATCAESNSFVCRNSKCIPQIKRCDGQNDCLDSSDEEECDTVFCKEPNYFRCKNSKCVFSLFLCDGENDCGDFSDEQNCENFKVDVGSTNCSSLEWQCADRLCIPQDFVCNGEKDCLDGSDETIGCTLNLKCDAFKCNNGHCVPNEWVCDGNNDCHDNSDEQNCDSHIKPQDCLLDSKLFLCANNATCIQLSEVCDNKPQCPDKSDEGLLCTNSKNTCSSHGCSHTCVQLPAGPKCLCPDGYTTIDDKTCRDINECEIYGICDQKCRNLQGSHECYCDDRYVLQKDKKSCKVVGGEAMMIFSSKTEIRGYFLQSELLFPISKDLKQVVGVSFDGHHVYWTDIFSEHESIVRSLEDGSKRELIVTSGLGAPEDLAVDWITGNIYFTDSELAHIGVCSNNGDHCTVLINKDIHKPRGIVLNPFEGNMYWSDWGDKPQIAKSKMDGTQDVAFVADNIRWPNGLTIDYPNERLYWADAKLTTLESVRLDGTDRRIILDGIVKHPYAISIFENRLYWSDWATHSVQSCDKFTGKEHHTLIKEKREYIYGIHIYHSALKPRFSNPCVTSLCSDICLISGPKTYTCACPQDKELGADKHTCKVLTKKQVLIIGAKDMLVKVEHKLLGRHEISALPTVAKDIGALTYDALNNTIYIADTATKAIISVNLNSGYSSPMFNENIGIISAIDFDYLGNNIYWCDSEKATIEVLSLTTMSHKILLHDMGGEIPTSLAIIPEEGVMFVAMRKKTEHGVHIDRLRMDGTGRTHVIESGLIGPVTLHYDFTLHRVFWADAGTGNLESTSADGDDRHAFRALHTTPVSLTTLSKELFWTNQKSRRLYWASKDNSDNGLNKKITLDIPDNIDVMHVASITPIRVPIHPCHTNNGNCSHLCLVSDKTTHCSCPMGMALKNDNSTCIKRRECTTNEFYCDKSDICVPKELRCNGRKDCLLGEDEKDCILKNHCPANYFQCQNGDCIRNSLVCDLHYDCKDRSDELDCADKLSKKKCASNYFKCSDDQCIADRFVCDGIKDCSDGGDEENCLSTSCDAKQFRCQTGLCIPKNWECDHEYDCPDLSDEHDECLQKTCTPNQFTCKNGRCIDIELKCNKVDDCNDQSDEESCGRKGDSKCRPQEFQCTSDTAICVPETARCNGTSECPHHEDEQGCSDCHVDEYECRNKKCIPSFWICDLTDDCGDNSDESPDLCFHTPNAEVKMNVPCEHGFRCKSGACIDLDLVCNGEENCYDGSDENGACQTSCKAKSNPCDQKCKATPTGPMCLCHEGYQLNGDGQSCKDIPECSQDPSVCSQLCVEKAGGFSCGCHEGFLLRSDRRSCKSIGEPMSLIFTVDNEIRELSQSTLTVLNSEESPKITGLDVSTADGYIFFSIEESGTIHRFNIQNKTREFITQTGMPQKLAVDWITNNVYYVDGDRVDKSIRVCNFYDQRCSKIINIDPHSQVNALAIDANNKYIFYSVTNWWLFNSPHSVIYKANLDGTKTQELVKSTSGYVSGITYDANKRLVYYSDQYNGYIHRVNYDGSLNSLLISNLTKVNGLSFFENHLYFLTSYGYMGKCRLFGETRACDTFRLNAYSSELFAISQLSRQKSSRNICAGHDCNHLCIPSDVGARCICESGKNVDEGEECNENIRTSGVEDKRPKFETKPSQGSGNNASSTITAGVVVPILIVLLGLTSYFVIKRRSSEKYDIRRVLPKTNGCPTFSISSITKKFSTNKLQENMRFQNPAYGFAPSEAAPVLQPGQHEYCNPVNQQQDFQSATNAILQKAHPLVKLDD